MLNRHHWVGGNSLQAISPTGRKVGQGAVDLWKSRAKWPSSEVFDWVFPIYAIQLLGIHGYPPFQETSFRTALISFAKNWPSGVMIAVATTFPKEIEGLEWAKSSVNGGFEWVFYIKTGKSIDTCSPFTYDFPRFSHNPCI